MEPTKEEIDRSWLQSATSNIETNMITGETRERERIDLKEFARLNGWPTCPLCGKPSFSNFGTFLCPYCGYGREEYDKWSKIMIEQEEQSRQRLRKVPEKESKWYAKIKEYWGKR